MAAREAYSLYVERAVEGANEADEPLSSLYRLRIAPLAVGGPHDGLDAAADVPVTDHLDEAGRGDGHEIVEDAIGHVLVKGAFVPVRPHVQLDRLELDQVLVGDIGDPNRREVGLAGHRTDAGELRDLEADLVVAAWMRVRHHVELPRRRGRHAPTLPRVRHGGQARPPLDGASIHIAQCPPLTAA